MIKLLIGGSPCTYWSCAQKNNRETEPSGMGWELFKNYLIAKEKFKPDYFLYENNKSAAQAIKDEIKKQFGVWDGTFLTEDTGARYIEINSALVSAQNRQRFYVHNCGDVQQPKDRGILLRDILESGTDICQNEKSYCLTATYSGAIPQNTIKRNQRTMVAEAIRIPEYSTEKSRPLTASYAHKGAGEGSLASECFPDNPNKQVFDYIAEPVIFQTPRGNNAGGCKYEKSPTMTANASWQDNNKVVEPARVGTYPSEAKNKESKQYRIYDINGKSTTLCGEGGGMGAKTGLYAIPIYYGAEAVEFDENGKPTKARSYADGKIYTVYEVRNGLITIKDKQYPIKLKDGYYIIRKLTVTECCRLQGMPDWWFLDKDGNKILSDTQSYKGLGNGWQLDTVKYILEHGLRNIPKDEEIILLSLYDGIGAGRRILEELGFAKVKYYAYEIDKYCIKLTSYRYPDIIHCGDAFKIRNKGEIEKII